MPLWIGFAVKGGIILAGVLLLFYAVRWLFRRGQDKQALKDTLKALEATDDARKREKEIVEAAKRVRDTPGPSLPDFVQPGPSGPPEPPGT